MLEQDQVTRWVVGLADGDQADERTSKFLVSSSLAWPRVLAHVRRELSHQGLNGDEVTSLALEIWEKTLRSVWMTWQLRPSWAARIDNLENYLIGAFHHRLNRHLKQKRRRDSIVEFRPPEELVAIKGEGNVDEDYAPRIHRGIQLEQAYATMNQNMRRALIARLYGFSWSEIAEKLQIGEQNLIMRVQYAIRKARGRFTQS
jgi:DNA-directed RNA polymerase specialized sigma24 family protein